MTVFRLNVAGRPMTHEPWCRQNLRRQNRELGGDLVSPLEAQFSEDNWHFPGWNSRQSVRLYSLAKSLVLCVLWTLGVCEIQTKAQAPVSEYAAKATSLALLSDYVRWPRLDGAQVAVGIVGDDPFGGALDTLDKIRFKRSKNVEDLKDCQIVFVPKSEQANNDAILASLEGVNVLTVGESEGFAKQGGMIGFVIVDDKVRFEINTAAARRAGIGIDLRLLKLAVRVFSS